MTKKELEKEVIELRKRVIKLERERAATIQRELLNLDRDIKECQKRLGSINNNKSFELDLELSDSSMPGHHAIHRIMYNW